MARQVIDLDTPQSGGGRGDSPRTAFTKVNDNFIELYSLDMTFSGAKTFAGVVTVNNAIGFSNYLDGKTTTSILAAQPNGAIFLRPNGIVDTAGQLRISSDGTMVSSKDINSGGSLTLRGTVYTTVDNTYSCGNSSFRWSVVYAATGAINTSDAREKTEVVPLSAAELRAARQLARELGTYQWLASLDAKAGEARHHVGMTVQRAIDVLAGEGLDPLRYGFICYDQWDATEAVVETWEAVVDDQGVVLAPGGSREVVPALPAGDRFSFRSDQLAFFVARGLAAELDEQAARLAALEAAR
ncbi:hypothetical protein FHY35_001433 [Xanthomonas arboricola]|uniref:tail fiber domain-containing protein n=1 Tax=Xanthomonas arboricola TaxID=56448 RepID=UPI00141AC05B|nr:tail fiber domain-containing protein [Xanthomonas arboricola]NIJ84478.1 hypothetical protein [Xanthomonas arboricola]